MGKHATLEMNGKTFVLVPRDEYETMVERVDLPALPPADADGNREAMPFMTATIARQIILRREAVKMSQKALALAAGVRPETLNRLEKGKNIPDTATISKIDKALKKAER
jgi:DNA-binding XRE family transcriptional regulator